MPTARKTRRPRGTQARVGPVQVALTLIAAGFIVVVLLYGVNRPDESAPQITASGGGAAPVASSPASANAGQQTAHPSAQTGQPGQPQQQSANPPSTTGQGGGSATANSNTAPAQPPPAGNQTGPQ